MTSVQYMPRRDKTEIILRQSCQMNSEEHLEDCCTSISEEIYLKNVRYNVLMVYLVGIIHVEQTKKIFLPEQVCIYQVFIYMLS